MKIENQFLITVIGIVVVVIIMYSFGGHYIQSNIHHIEPVPEQSQANQSKLLKQDLEPYVTFIDSNTVMLEVNGIYFKLPLIYPEDYIK